MLAEHSVATVDILTDEGIPLVAEGGLAGLTAPQLARRCRNSRQAVQQWCHGRPLRELFAERFLGRWIQWCRIRTYDGRELVGLLPESDETVQWTRVWLALLESAPHEPQIGTWVRAALDAERALIARTAAPDRATAVQALIAGLRQARCHFPAAMEADQSEAILAAALA